MISPAPRDASAESLTALAASELRDVFPALRLPPEARSRPATLHNTVAVRELANGASALMWYGRRFDVPVVPYTVGIELDAIRRRMMQLVVDVTSGDLDADAADRERGALMTNAVALFASLVVAHGFLHRWTIRLFQINPFRHASDRDVSELLGFFLSCRRRSGVRSL